MRTTRRVTAGAAFALAIAVGFSLAAAPSCRGGGGSSAAPKPLPEGGIRVESAFSVIHVRDVGGQRHLLFEQAGGALVPQTYMDLAHPERLVGAYPRAMFLSFLVQPAQRDVLFVGLGGGAMVRFLRAHEAKTRITAVEIDPAVVSIAADFFGVQQDDLTRVVTGDAFDFVTASSDRFDAIYMDAFLAPPPPGPAPAAGNAGSAPEAPGGTNPAGIPRRLETRAFLRDLAARLTPTGVVAFNLKVHAGMDDEVALIDAVFGATWVFELEGSASLVVLATRSGARLDGPTLLARAREAMTRFGGSLDFPAMAARLRP